MTVGHKRTTPLQEQLEEYRDYLIGKLRKLPQEDLQELGRTIEALEEAHLKRKIIVHEQAKPY